MTLARNSVYALETSGDSAELTMYGDIVETQPVDFWTGEPVEGEYIALDGFLRDLEQVKGKKSLTIRMNSYGGDAGVSNTIHNRLRELSKEGTELTCIVDGVAMSGGSLIMCSCDHVLVNPSSIIMIHKCWSALYGAYNADELRDLARTQDAWDNALIEIYQRKTGLSRTVLSHMMSETTYMTGREAVEKGFADEVIADADPVPIAASANGRSLFVNGRQFRLPLGVFAPDSIPTIAPQAEPAAVEIKEPVETGEGGKPMTLEELKEQHPELLQEMQASVEAERQRLAEIDEVASLFSPEMVQEAKYGETACSAQELAYRAALKAAKNGQKFMADLKQDSQESGANQVNAVQPPKTEEPDMFADAKATAQAYLAMKKEVK